METRMRAMLDEIMNPIQLGIKEDKIKYTQLRYDYDCLLNRMKELEQFAMLKDYKPPRERLRIKEAARKAVEEKEAAKKAAEEKKEDGKDGEEEQNSGRKTPSPRKS